MKTRDIPDILLKFIKEEIGRSFKSAITDPYTFKDFQDYDIMIDGSTENGFFLTVTYKGEKVLPVSRYSNYEEAQHASRMIIDNDRIKRMNS